MNVKKLALCLALGLGVSVSTNALAAVTTKTKTSTATWDVTAVKDSTAGLVVSPTNSIKFVYDPVTKSWAGQKANFDIAVLGSEDPTVTTNSFKLEAQVGSIASVTNPIDDTKLDLDVAVGDTPLTNTSLTDVTELLPNVMDFTGADAEGESAASWLNVKIAKPTGEEWDAVSDGIYVGELSVNFVATWELDDGAV